MRKSWKTPTARGARPRCRDVETGCALRPTAGAHAEVLVRRVRRGVVLAAGCSSSDKQAPPAVSRVCEVGGGHGHRHPPRWDRRDERPRHVLLAHHSECRMRHARAHAHLEVAPTGSFSGGAALRLCKPASGERATYPLAPYTKGTTPAQGASILALRPLTGGTDLASTSSGTTDLEGAWPNKVSELGQVRPIPWDAEAVPLAPGGFLTVNARLSVSSVEQAAGKRRRRERCVQRAPRQGERRKLFRVELCAAPRLAPRSSPTE